MYTIHTLLIWALCVFKSEEWQWHDWQKFDTKNKSPLVANRILELMRSYYEEANARIIELNPIRFMYEESPHYEQGYLMGEIVERYKKIVEHAKKPKKLLSDSVIETLKSVEIVQKLYFEVYHLVRMMHEAIPKYKYSVEFFAESSDNYTITLDEILSMQKQVELMKARREKEKRKRMKQNEKLRQLYLKGLSQSAYGEKKTEYNKFWEIDYGWEIDYYW